MLGSLSCVSQLERFQFIFFAIHALMSTLSLMLMHALGTHARSARSPISWGVGGSTRMQNYKSLLHVMREPRPLSGSKEQLNEIRNESTRS